MPSRFYSILTFAWVVIVVVGMVPGAHGAVKEGSLLDKQNDGQSQQKFRRATGAGGAGGAGGVGDVADTGKSDSKTNVGHGKGDGLPSLPAFSLPAFPSLPSFNPPTFPSLPPFNPPWNPSEHHHARFIDGFNLMGMLPAPARDFVCGLLSGCPNLAVVESHESDEKSGNLVTVVASTIGVPTVMVAYFDYAAHFDRGNWTESIIQDLLRGDFAAALGMQARQFGALFAVPGVIEFADVDGDNMYTPDVDTLRQEYRMADAQWEAMETVKEPVPGTNDTVLNLKVSTQDKVMSLSFNVASQVLDRGQAHFTPNGTKIDITIAGFPYSKAGVEHGDSRLAIKAFVASGSLEENVNVATNDTFVIGSNGYFHWLGEVESLVPKHVNASAPPEWDSVNASVIPKWIHGMDTEDLKNSIANLIVDVNSQQWSAAETVYFSINATMPKLAYWDPNLGYSPGVDGGGNTPNNNGGNGSGSPKSNTPTYVGVGVGSAFLVGAAGILVIVKRRKAQQKKDFPALLPTDKPTTEP